MNKLILHEPLADIGTRASINMSSLGQTSTTKGCLKARTTTKTACMKYTGKIVLKKVIDKRRGGGDLQCEY